MTAIGIDTHKATWRRAPSMSSASRSTNVSSPTTRPATGRCCRGPIGFSDVRIGLEGSAGFGAAAARSLVAAGREVREVPPQLSHRERQRTRRAGKSDRGDALAIARVTAREADLPPVRLADATHDIALLVEAREDLVAEATRVRNRLHADLVVLVPGYGAKAANLVALRNRQTAARLLRPLRGLQSELARERLASLGRLIAESKVIEDRLADLVGDHPLLNLPGAGVLVTAKLIGEAGDVSRFRSADAFAMLAGVAPIPGQLGADPADATQPRRQPTTQPGALLDRPRPSLASPAGEGLRRAQTCGGQDVAGGTPGAQATSRTGRLQAARWTDRGRPTGRLTR